MGCLLPPRNFTTICVVDGLCPELVLESDPVNDRGDVIALDHDSAGSPGKHVELSHRARTLPMPSKSRLAFQAPGARNGNRHCATTTSPSNPLLPHGSWKPRSILAPSCKSEPSGPPTSRVRVRANVRGPPPRSAARMGITAKLVSSIPWVGGRHLQRDGNTGFCARRCRVRTSSE